MSELSKLRDRWIRHERAIAKLEVEFEQAADYETSAILNKIAIVKDRLTLTIEATHVEELRLIQPDARLIFRPKPRFQAQTTQGKETEADEGGRLMARIRSRQPAVAPMPYAPLDRHQAHYQRRGGNQHGFGRYPDAYPLTPTADVRAIRRAERSRDELLGADPEWWAHNRD